MSYASNNHYGHEPNDGEFLLHFLVCEFQHIPKDSGICLRWFLFLSWKSLNQRCSETPKFATNKMDRRGLFSPDSDCRLVEGLTSPCTRQPGGFGRFDVTCHFQYLVMLYRFFCLWWHLDILPWIANFWLWFFIALYWCFASLWNQKAERHALCVISKMSLNAVTAIFSLPWWVFWVAIGWRNSYMRYWLQS